MRSILQVALLIAAVVGVGLSIRRRSIVDRWWICALLGLVGFAINGFIVPLGGLFLLILALGHQGAPTGSSAPGRTVTSDV